MKLTSNIFLPSQRHEWVDYSEDYEHVLASYVLWWEFKTRLYSATQKMIPHQKATKYILDNQHWEKVE